MPAEEDYAKANSIADELEMEEDEREEFLESFMSRKKYKKIHSWVDPDPEPDPKEKERPKGLIRQKPKEDPKPKGQYSE